MFKIKLGGGRTQEVEESMYWHTTSHIMAQAIKRLFPDAKLTIGPSIEKGFYYDFDVEKPFTENDLSAIEEEMKKIIKEDLPIERFELPREEAIKLMEERILKSHKISIFNRSSGIISGVKEVISFDPNEIILDTEQGMLMIQGEELHVTKLTVEKGEVEIEGLVYSMVYSDEGGMTGEKGGLLRRLFH